MLSCCFTCVGASSGVRFSFFFFPETLFSSVAQGTVCVSERACSLAATLALGAKPGFDPSGFVVL
jgi:hypothetical protein